jgi:hypothetical protein
MHAYIKHGTANIKHFLADGRVRVPLSSYFNHPGAGYDTVLGGVGEMLQARSRHRIYWVHVIWIVNLFLYLVIAWWIFYRWRDQQPWNFYLFLFVLISPTILYLASLLLFPREGDADTAIDYKAHYYANHRAFFILFALFVPVDIVDSLLKGLSHFLALGPIYFVSSVLYFTGLIIAAITRNERYHEFYAAFFLIQTTVVSFLIFQTLV